MLGEHRCAPRQEAKPKIHAVALDSSFQHELLFFLERVPRSSGSFTYGFTVPEPSHRGIPCLGGYQGADGKLL